MKHEKERERERARERERVKWKLLNACTHKCLFVGRSILTVPWVELGGKVQISCAKTGYSATIEFHTKVCMTTSAPCWQICAGYLFPFLGCLCLLCFSVFLTLSSWWVPRFFLLRTELSDIPNVCFFVWHLWVLASMGHLPWREAGDVRFPAPCPESQGCHLSRLSYLLSCFSA